MNLCIQDPSLLKCEIAVALMTGGITPIDEDKLCQTAEIFSPTDKACSSQKLPLLKLGVSGHTSHFVDGEILLCGGHGCTGDFGGVYKTIGDKVSYRPSQTCLKMNEDKTWQYHSALYQGDRFTYRANHLGAIQFNTLELVGGDGSMGDFVPSTRLIDGQWVEGRTPGLPYTIFKHGFYRQCLVVTSPHTYIVLGGSSDKRKSRQANYY